MEERPPVTWVIDLDGIQEHGYHRHGVVYTEYAWGVQGQHLITGYNVPKHVKSPAWCSTLRELNKDWSSQSLSGVSPPPPTSPHLSFHPTQPHPNTTPPCLALPHPTPPRLGTATQVRVELRFNNIPALSQ